MTVRCTDAESAAKFMIRYVFISAIKENLTHTSSQRILRNEAVDTDPGIQQRWENEADKALTSWLKIEI